MRQGELTNGIPVFDDNNERLGESKAAARSAISQVAISRIIMAMPGMGEYQGNIIILDYFEYEVPIAFSSPGAQPEVVPFLVLNKSPYIFLIIIPNFQLQIQYTFEVKQKMYLFPVYIYQFWFPYAVSQTYFCSRGENKKQSWCKIVQNVS